MRRVTYQTTDTSHQERKSQCLHYRVVVGGAAAVDVNYLSLFLLLMLPLLLLVMMAMTGKKMTYVVW